MTLSNLIPDLHYPSRLEKLVDGWVHGVALGVFTLAVFAALGLAIWQGGLGMASAVAVYAICVITMIGCSMAYNLAENSKRKSLLRRLDHAAIFLMIAGTYTPFTTIRFDGAWAISMTTIIWALTLVGAAGKLFFPRAGKNIWIGVYANGAFFITNSAAPNATWTGIWIGLVNALPVAGRFTNATNDCIGVVDGANFPPYGTAFALYFACNLTSGPTPAFTVQWLSVLLPDSQGFRGTHQFGAGDFDGDGIDTIACRRGAYIAWTNIVPTIVGSQFNLAQYIGAPNANDAGTFVVGDWDGNNLASFGLFYQNSYFYRRDDLSWNSGLYTLQQVGQPIGTTGITPQSWRG